jgi:hypothetical protein
MDIARVFHSCYERRAAHCRRFMGERLGRLCVESKRRPLLAIQVIINSSGELTKDLNLQQTMALK